MFGLKKIQTRRVEHLTLNGVTTTKDREVLCYERVTEPHERIFWDFRDKNGTLHTGVSKTLQNAVQYVKDFLPDWEKQNG